MKQQNWSLALPVLFPYSIPVLFPAPSLFAPCYKLAPSEKKNLKMPMESRFCMPWWVTALGIFPVFFPVNGNFRPETGSLMTASTAMQSAAQRTVL
jgi:hypothetical protein